MRLQRACHGGIADCLHCVRIWARVLSMGSGSSAMSVKSQSSLPMDVFALKEPAAASMDSGVIGALVSRLLLAVAMACVMAESIGEVL